MDDFDDLDDLVVIVTKSDGPAKMFPDREDFLKVIEEAMIEDTFSNYLRVDALGRLSYTTKDGNNVSWPTQSFTTPDFEEFAARSRKRWDFFRYVGYVLTDLLTNGRKSEAAAERVREEDFYLTDFTDFIKKFEPDGGFKPEESVLMLDTRVADKYLSALEEQGIKSDIYWND